MTAPRSTSTIRPRGWPPGKITVNVAVVVVLLLLASWLPPDTSMHVVQERGSLRVCVPSAYPPLVNVPGSALPGLDVELLSGAAERLGLTLVRVENPAIGRDFNPRNWRVTRAQCEVIAGGVVASTTTRSFLETTDPHLETGWAVVFPAAPHALSGSSIGFHAGTSGLDRISLSRYLQDMGATVRIFSNSGELQRALADGDVDAGVTESLLARQIASELDGQAAWLPGLQRYPLAFGLWKGDLTLKRALQSAIDGLEADGSLDEIFARYDIEEINECEPCSAPSGQDERGYATRPGESTGG